MLNKNAALVFGLVLLICVCFTTCENPVMKKWWVDPAAAAEPEPDYIAITKTIAQLVYETIIEKEYIYEQLPPQIITAPPEIMLQYIDIINIEYIIFAGDSVIYNQVISPTGGTPLTTQEENSNKSIVTAMAGELNNTGNEGYMLILHGHANPVTGTVAEAIELAQISLARANAVADEFKESPYSIASDRITTKGYGGGRNISGASTSYASLNRRVEAILFQILDEPKTGGGGG